MNWDDPKEIHQKLSQDPSGTLGLAFSEFRPAFFRLVEFRMDPVLAMRVDPDDVLQEAWVAASDRLNHFLKPQPVSSSDESASMSLFVWLRLIVMQTLVDQQRHHLGAKKRDVYRQRSIHQGATDTADLTSISLVQKLMGNWTSPSGVAIRKEKADQLRQAVQSMDPIDREVLALRHFEELTNSQTAEVLGIQQKAASIRYIRSLKRLKNLLKEMPEFGEGFF